MSSDEFKKLKKARKKMGLKQREVAKEIGIETNSYARIEQGRAKPSYNTFKKICQVLKLPFPVNYS